MNNNPQKDLLLHTCCGPCAAGCVGTLANADRKFVMYFSNSNLSDEEEYERRLEAAKKVAEISGTELIADPYDHEAWLKTVRGYENEPERGARCRLCFQFSLSRTAQMAEQKAMNFATTLTVSPHKSSKLIFEIGSAWALFEPWDFKKKDGFKRSVENSKAWELYRQNYCGCEFSKMSINNKEKKQ